MANVYTRILALLRLEKCLQINLFLKHFLKFPENLATWDYVFC